jgi:hypothetical protein
MHINTKVVFEWDDKAQEYRETSSEGYEYDGEMALCTHHSALDRNSEPLFGVPYDSVNPYTPNAQNLFNQYGSEQQLSPHLQSAYTPPHMQPSQPQGGLGPFGLPTWTTQDPNNNFIQRAMNDPSYQPTNNTASGPSRAGRFFNGLLGGVAGAGQWGANQLQGQQGLAPDAEGNWLDPALNIFGSYMQSKQGKAKQTSPEDLRENLMKGMEPTLGTYEDIGKMAYGGGPIMDAARQKMRGGLHDASAQASNQMNTQLAQRGVGGLGDILNRKNLSQMTEQMNKGETDLTRYGVEAGLKGLQGTADIRGGINTAVANLKQYNQNQSNYHRAQQAAGSSAMYSGLLRGGLNFLGNQFGGSV